MFFQNSLAFSMIQWMLAIWSLVPLPFLKPARTSGSSRFTYCSSLAWRILSIILLVCHISAIECSLSILWHCLSFGLDWKLTFSSFHKHPFPTTQEKTLHMDITRWSMPKSDWLYSLQPKLEKLYTVSKNKTGSWLWLRSWTPYCQIQTEIEEK